MNLLQPDHTIFYAIEKAIKSYRRYAQIELKKICKDLTIDQLLVLSKMETHPTISHLKLSELIFKDMASISRMLTALEKKEYIKRTLDPENRRRFNTEITNKGKEVLAKLKPQVIQNRTAALQEIDEKELEVCIQVLNKIADNVTSKI